MENNEDAAEFLQSLEDKWQGHITWKTFSTWFACTDGTIRDYGIFMVKINNTFFFQDFERENAIFGMKLTTKKKKQKFVLMEGSFHKDEVTDVYQVTQVNARAIVEKGKSVDSVKKATKVDKLFKKIVTLVKLKNGTALFFEFLDYKEFLNELK